MANEEKLRRLKKYEARDEVLFRDAQSETMEFLSPFGPLIARTHVPNFLIDHLNNHIDMRVVDGQGCEFLLSEEFCCSGGDDSLVEWISSQIHRYVCGVEQTEPDAIHLQQFWVVSQYANTPSPMHFHSGDISGVLYLRVPHVDLGQEDRNYISGRQAGYINFMIGGKQRFSRSLISFKPIVGELLIFPAWLLHGAEPFKGSSERRSLAFNAAVD